MSHWLLHFFGLDSASGTAYLAWSGVLSDLGEVTIVGGMLAIYRKHNCHRRWCWRFGHHDFMDEATGLTVKLCRKCHPAHPGRRFTKLHIARIHERNQEARDDTQV